MACKIHADVNVAFRPEKSDMDSAGSLSTTLAQRNVQHNNDDVSDWKLTGLLLVSRSE